MFFSASGKKEQHKLKIDWFGVNIPF